MMVKHFKLLCAAALFCLSAAAQAHRFHMGITEVGFNERSGSTEVVHTYMAHDIEDLLMNLYGRQFDLTDPEDQAVLRKYVEGRFWLQGQDKARLPLRWVGMTADSQSVVIYQELDKAPLSKTVLIHQGVLSDFLPEQVNTVNLTEAGAVRSLTFTQAVTEQPTQENKQQ